MQKIFFYNYTDTDNQILPRGVTPMEEQQKKFNIQSDIKTLTLLGKHCEMEKIMKFLKEIEIFEEI